jgi:hypothetical protein
VDTLDSFFVLMSLYDSSNGLSDAALKSVIFWLRGIPITMPEAIVALEDSKWDKQAIKMKAILGYWQSYRITYSNQRILLNNIDYTKEIVGLLQALAGTSWGAFGTALGGMLSKVPASHSLSLPIGYGCPPSWWNCTDDETNLISFVANIIVSMELDGITDQMVENAVDEKDIIYLYHFYNMAAITNMNGGFNQTEAKEAFISLYQAIKKLTDADVSGSAEISAISFFQTATQSVAAPRVVVANNKVYLNGQSVWFDFSNVILSLSQGYIDRAGISIGKILLALNTPQQDVTEGNDTIVPTESDTSHAREFLSNLLAAQSQSTEDTILELISKLDSCAGKITPAVINSAKTLAALKQGKWKEALYYGSTSLCNYAEIADDCQDKFDLPEEIYEICDEFKFWTDIVLNPKKYIFMVAEKNIFPYFIKAANSAYQGMEEELGLFFRDAAGEVGSCLKDLWKGVLSGPMLSISAAAVLIAAQL